MVVDLMLRSISLDTIDHWNGTSKTLPLLESATEDEERDALVRVHYLKVQPTSPEFTEKFESIDQNIDIELSTFVFSAEPRPVIALYDFMMATFVSGKNAPSSGAVTPTPVATLDGEGGALAVSPPSAEPAPPPPGKIRLGLGLTGVKREFFDCFSFVLNTHNTDFEL